MQLQSDKSHLDEIKIQFRAREGYYRLISSPDYSQRCQRNMGFGSGTTNSNSSTANNEKTCMKISLVTLNDQDDNNDDVADSDPLNHQSNRLKSNSSPGRSPKSKTRHNPSSRICFNIGRELLVYDYNSIKTGPDASNHLYKRLYKTSSPTCHDFNQTTASSDSLMLLVGFSHGQVQLIDVNNNDDMDVCKEFNIDRLIDKTRVTCTKWLPNSPSLFLVAHASGHLYLYKDDLPCGPAAPIYQVYKESEGLTVHACKSKTTRNPIYKWSFSSQSNDYSQSSAASGSSSSHSSSNSQVSNGESCALNEFAFSSCAKYIACVSQDGFLRVYCYDVMELIGRARSYYGGLSCVCWSPDGKYVITGGEDDLITVWSFVERRVVARCRGHKSWVSVVAFDSFYTGYDPRFADVDDNDDEDEDLNDRDLDYDDTDENPDEIRSYDGSYASRKLNGLSRIGGVAFKSPINQRNDADRSISRGQTMDNCDESETKSTSYRFGSVGQDTMLCLWDLNDDLLRQSVAKSKITTATSALSAISLNNTSDHCETSSTLPRNQDIQSSGKSATGSSSSANKESTTSGFLSSKGSGFTKTFSLVGRRDKRLASQRNFDKNIDNKNNQSNLQSGGTKSLLEDPTKLLGSPVCPKINEVPVLEPTICKKISAERLTSLVFFEKGFLTSCQSGSIMSWARPFR